MKKSILLLFALSMGLNLFAADFTVDSISYNITSVIEPYTVEVTRSTSNYTGSVCIPATVNYNGIDYSVTTIGYLGFENGLTSISLPVSITSIGDNVFGECYNLASVSLPDSLISIGNNAFYKCYSLTSINIPSSLKSIGAEAFYNCFGLTSINLPASLTSIGGGAFAGCHGFTSISIPASLTSIGAGVFNSCTHLTSVSLPNSTFSIGSSAFENCWALTSISLPASVTSIGSSAFKYCTGLASIYTYSATPASISLSNSVFSNLNTTKCILYVPSGSKSLYQAAAQWKNFTKIVEFNPTSAEIIGADALEIYPNPVEEGFYVSGLQKETLLYVYDINGKMLLRTLTSNKHEISTKELPAGVYVVKVEGMNKKIVVKK